MFQINSGPLSCYRQTNKEVQTMRKAYSPPELSVHGSLVKITGIFGGPSPQDVLVDPSGNVVLEGDQSIDACAEVDGDCIVDPQ